jgi:hypothetical protein
VDVANLSHTSHPEQQQHEHPLHRVVSEDEEGMRRLGGEAPQVHQRRPRVRCAHQRTQEDGSEAITWPRVEAIFEGRGEIEDLSDPAEEGAPDALQEAIHRANAIGRMRTEARRREEEQERRAQVVPWRAQPAIQNHQEALRRANKIGSRRVMARRLEHEHEQIRAARHRTRGLELPAESEQATWNRCHISIAMWVHDQQSWQGNTEGGLERVDVELLAEVLPLLQLPPRRDEGSVPTDPESIMPPT